MPNAADINAPRHGIASETPLRRSQIRRAVAGTRNLMAEIVSGELPPPSAMLAAVLATEKQAAADNATTTPIHMRGRAAASIADIAPPRAPPVEFFVRPALSNFVTH